MAGQPNTPDAPLYNLRLATEDDIDTVVEMAHKFYNETPFPQFVEWDEDSVAHYVFNIIDNGLVILCEYAEDKRVVGMLGLMYTPFPYNTAVLTATEAAFWLDPEHRGVHLARAMKDVAESCAEEEGCSVVSFMTLASSPPQVDMLYRQNGLQPVETAYMKRL